MSKEAMKLALEVMQNQGDVSVDEWIAAEKALREALAEQPAQQEPTKAAKLVDALIAKYSDKLFDSVGPHDAAKFEEDCNHIKQALAEQPAQQEPVADKHQAFIDSLSSYMEDKMFEQIHYWARQSYARHQRSTRGQTITAADSSDNHIIWAALRWAKENAATPQAQPAQEPLTPAQKIALAEDWFAEDWAITKAVGMMVEYEMRIAHGITKGTK